MLSLSYSVPSVIPIMLPKVHPCLQKKILWPSLCPCHLSRYSPSSFCMPAIILVILHTCCHPHCSSLLGKRMNFFFSQTPFHSCWCSLLSFPKPLVVPLVPMLHYHPFSCHWSAKKQFLLPQSPLSTPAVPMVHVSWNNPKKKQNPKPPGPTPSFFFYPRHPESHQARQPCKKHWIWILFYCSNQSEIYLLAMLKFTGHTIFMTEGLWP